MRLCLITTIMLGMFSGPLISLSAWGQDAKNRQPDRQEYQNLMLASGKRIDPELEKRVAAYEKHFVAREAAYANYRDHTIRVLKGNPNFTEDEKRIKISKVQEQYRKRSWNLVRKYREPVNERLIELTNAGLSETERVEAGMGKELFIEQTIIENGKKKIIQVRNPDHSGALSDTDTQAGTKGIERIAKIAEAHGIKVIRDGNTVDMPGIEHTINRHAHSPEPKDNANSSAKQKRLDAAARYNERFLAGSSATQAQLYADARNKERFLFVGIDEENKSLSGMREAVEKRDHMKKAADGVNLGNQKPGLLLQEENRAEFQKFGKSTNKMMSNISDTELKAFMRKNKLSGTAEAYRKSLAALHGRKWENVDVNDKNVDAWFKTSRDIQALSLQKADKNSALDIAQNNAELQRLSKKLSNDNLPETEKRQITRQYFRKKADLIDAKERLKQTQGVLDEKLGKNDAGLPNLKKPGIFSDIPGKSETRRKLNALADTNYRKIGKGMGYYAKVKKAQRVVQLIQQGDAREMAKYAYAETRDEITDRFKERLVPGYGKMKLAFDVGWGTGRLIGENIRLGSGGPTVDEVAEKQMFNIYDAISGNRQLKWDQERESAYRDYFMERVAENPGAVPAGMTKQKLLMLARENAEKGGNFYETLDKILEKGEARIEAQNKAKSDYLSERNAELIEDSKRAGLVREALDTGFSPYELSGRTFEELQAMINARGPGASQKLKGFTINATRESYDGPPLTGNVSNGDILAFQANVRHPVAEPPLLTELYWQLYDVRDKAIEGVNKRYQAIESDKEVNYRFRFKLNALEDGRYKVALTHRLIENSDVFVQSVTHFNLYQDIKINKLVVTANPENQEKRKILYGDEKPYFYVYYELGKDVAGVNVRMEIKNRKTGAVLVSQNIYRERKEGKIQRVGFTLEKDAIKTGVSADFAATLTRDDGKNTTASTSFTVSDYALILAIPKTLVSGKPRDFKIKVPKVFEPPYKIDINSASGLSIGHNKGKLSGTVTGIATKDAIDAKVSVSVNDAKGRKGTSFASVRVAAKPKPKKKVPSYTVKDNSELLARKKKELAKLDDGWWRSYWRSRCNYLDDHPYQNLTYAELPYEERRKCDVSKQTHNKMILRMKRLQAEIEALGGEHKIAKSKLVLDKIGTK